MYADENFRAIDEAADINTRVSCADKELWCVKALTCSVQKRNSVIVKAMAATAFLWITTACFWRCSLLLLCDNICYCLFVWGVFLFMKRSKRFESSQQSYEKNNLHGFLF
mmetsp:Transcript_32355/g.47179  ORF Transcript_32355/g.47179 Transcript_32355/m.47179 type:complete len:110 (+) Transcript_32355:787-1116(+)